MKRIGKNLWDMLPSLLVASIPVFIRTVPGQRTQILFVICVGIAVLALLFMQNNRFQKRCVRFAVIVFIGILLYSLATAGSFSAYWEKIVGSSQPYGISDDDWTHFLKEAQENNALETEIAGSIDINLSEILDSMETAEDILAERRFFDSKEDPKEIERLTALIDEKIKAISAAGDNDFSNIQTDAHALELFYKVQLSDDPHCYSNAIKALEAYGVDCKKLSEYTLARWDTETLFIIYSMRRSILEDAANNIIYDDEKIFYYRDFPIEQHTYTDTFNYGDRQWEYPANTSKTSAKEIAESMDKRIMGYYRKFSMNFADGRD